MTDAPRISPVEVSKFIDDMNLPRGGIGYALAAFLAARVGPSVRASGSAFGVDWTLGFNACRDIVWKGK